MMHPLMNDPDAQQRRMAARFSGLFLLAATITALAAIYLVDGDWAAVLAATAGICVLLAIIWAVVWALLRA